MGEEAKKRSDFFLVTGKTSSWSFFQTNSDNFDWTGHFYTLTFSFSFSHFLSLSFSLFLLLDFSLCFYFSLSLALSTSILFSSSFWASITWKEERRTSHQSAPALKQIFFFCTTPSHVFWSKWVYWEGKLVARLFNSIPNTGIQSWTSWLHFLRATIFEDQLARFLFSSPFLSIPEPDFEGMWRMTWNNEKTVDPFRLSHVCHSSKVFLF